MELANGTTKTIYSEIRQVTDNETVYAVLEEFFESMVIYNSAIKEVGTKLEILNDEFQSKNKRNPIEHIKSRVKRPRSIIDKLERKGLPPSMKSIRENLNDIAGIRVICSFITDIYMIADMLKAQDDLRLISEKDYIKHPKENGYRSLHLVLEVPVYFSDHTEYVRVEIQIRTIAMDFWASLEHKLRYKIKGVIPEEISTELKDCADIISKTDIRMEKIHTIVERLE